MIASRLASGMIDEVEKSRKEHGHGQSPRGSHAPRALHGLRVALQPFEPVLARLASVYPSQHRPLRLKSTFGNAARGHHSRGRGGREANVWHLSLRATAEGERGQKKMTLL